MKYVLKYKPGLSLPKPVYPLIEWQNERVKSNKLPKNKLILKRVLDIVLSSFLIITIMSWLLPLLALIIKLDSKGPVFFIQKRTGKNRRSFSCIKFRTMVKNKDCNRKRVQENDLRITKVGYYLRKYFIDELPQLFNVFIGNMSLVGPRPFMLRDCISDAAQIPNYHKRHLMKPGITGLAQSRGYYGMLKNSKDLENRIFSDFEYIDRWSISLDLYIMYRTIILLIR